MLEGRSGVARNGPLVRITTHAASGGVEMRVERDADPLTGLLAAATETVSARIAEGAGERRSSRTSTTQVERLDPAVWAR